MIAWFWSGLSTYSRQMAEHRWLRALRGLNGGVVSLGRCFLPGTLLLAVLLPFQSAVGQDSQPVSTSFDARQGHFSGTVADPTDAVIPGATVTIHSVKGGVERTSTTDKVGRFQFEDLAFGQYTVSIA